MRKALLMLFGLKKHDLCFLVTLSILVSMLCCRISGDGVIIEAINVRQVVEAKGAFWYSLEASEVSQSEKSIVDAFWIEKA